MEKTGPIIIPRDRHTLSRKLLSRNALKVMYRLREKGFIAYLVGGGVRDVLLGREPKDFDIVTDATPGQIKKIFRNSRIIGRRFRLVHIHFGEEIVEVATFRSSRDAEPEESALPEEGGVAEDLARPPRRLKTEEGLIVRDNVFGTPEEDAFRRDFTVNALCYNIEDFTIIDYVGGMEDLQRGIIRTIGDPDQRFVEDPVRMLRAVRFAAMLGFEVEQVTWEAIVRNSSHITKSAPPRLYEEMQKLFLLGTAERTYQLMRQAGLFQVLFPDFSRWLSRESEGFPHIRTGKALEWIDFRIGDKIQVSPQLLMTLMFGEYLEEKIACLRQQGLPFHPALSEAVAGLLAELAPTVLVPNRVGVQMKEILAYQQRFRKTPGRQPLQFLARPGIDDAFAYLEFMGTFKAEDSQLHRWWVAFRTVNPPELASEGEKPAARRRRRRRRRRKPQLGGSQESGTAAGASSNSVHE